MHSPSEEGAVQGSLGGLPLTPQKVSSDALYSSVLLVNKSYLCHTCLYYASLPILTLPLYSLFISILSLAAAFLVESVKTLTDEDAASGAELTRLSITEALMDKQQYVFDDLLNLPAMKAITAEPLHEVGGMLP